jgi:hypothetical protein
MSNGRQFSAVAAFRHGVRSVIENIPAAFAMSWPWLVVGGLLSIYPYYIILTSGVIDNPTSKVSAPFLFAVLFLAVLFMTVFASIAVNWHRYILKDEWPAGWNKVRLDRHVFRYLLNIILVSLVVVLIAIIPISIFAYLLTGGVKTFEESEFSLANIVISGVGSFFFGGLFFKYALKLPAVALGRGDYGMRDSSRDTAGNFVQLGLLSSLSWLLNMALNFAGLGLVWASGEIGSNIALSVSIAITFFATWLLGLLGITFLSSLYGYFAEHREF